MYIFSLCFVFQSYQFFNELGTKQINKNTFVSPCKNAGEFLVFYLSWFPSYKKETLTKNIIYIVTIVVFIYIRSPFLNSMFGNVDFHLVSGPLHLSHLCPPQSNRGRAPRTTARVLSYLQINTNTFREAHLSSFKPIQTSSRSVQD